MNALQKTAITLRLGGGVETKLDDKVVPQTKLLALENGIFTRGLTIAKRNGYESITTAVLGQVAGYDSTRTRGLATRQLPNRQDELLLFTDDRCYSLIEGSDAWSDCGVVQSVGQSDRALVKTGTSQTASDYASYSGIAISAWEDSRGGVYFAVVEDDGGRVIQGPMQASSIGKRPRCVRVDAKLAVVWVEDGMQQLKIIVIDPSAPDSYATSLFPNVLVADLVGDQPGFDVAFVSRPGQDHDGAVIAWNSVDGVRVGWIDSSGVIGSAVTHWPGAVTLAAGTVLAGPSVSAAPWDPNRWAVVWAENLTMLATWVNGGQSTLAAQFGTVSMVTGVDPNIVTCAWRRAAVGGLDVIDAWWEERANPVRNSVVMRRAVTSAGVVQAQDPVGRGGQFRGASLASHAWTDPPDPALAADGSATSASYVTVIHDVPLFSVLVVVRHDGIQVSRSLSGSASHAQGWISTGSSPPATTPGHAPIGGSLSSVTPVDVASRSYRFATSYKTLLISPNDDQFSEDGIRLVEIDFGDAAAHQNAQIGACLYLGGACPMLYDGQSWIESNFHYGIDWEDGEVLHTTSVGGGGIANGTYDYAFYPEYTTTTGEVIRGPVSKPYTVTIAGADNTVTIEIPTVRLTHMTSDAATNRADCVIVVERTKAGDSTVYYRCSTLSVANDIGVDTIEFIDAMDDDTLAMREPAYDNGDVPSNDPTPSTLVIAAGKGRIFWTDPSIPGMVHHSQSLADGYTAEVPPSMVVGVDSFGGPVTAVSVMDDSVVIFKRASIYVISGPGPLADPGLGGGWSAPSLVTSDVGCVSQRSLAVTPSGLVFQATKGIYLLDRSLQVTYVGAPVEGFNAQTITRATLIEDTHQVRFLTDSGSALLYDYFFDQWSTFTNHEGVDAVNVAGVYHYLRADGRVFREITNPLDAGASTDGGQSYPLVMETAWIHMQQQLQGMQRIWRVLAIGNWKSAHVLRMQYRTDYQGDWSAWASVDATSQGGSGFGSSTFGTGPFGGTPNPAYQWRWYLGVRCQAIQFRFSDYSYVGQAGPGFELTELLIEGGVVAPVAKISASRST